jgi:hypothetical protein
LRNGVQVRLRIRGEVRAARQVLSQQAVGVLVRAPRPGRDAELRYDDLRGALDEQMAALEKLLETSR